MWRNLHVIVLKKVLPVVVVGVVEIRGHRLARTGYMNYLFGRTVKCVCRNRGHVDCYLFLNFEPHGYSTVVTEAVHWLQRGVGRSQSDHRSDKPGVEAAMRRKQV